MEKIAVHKFKHHEHRHVIISFVIGLNIQQSADQYYKQLGTLLSNQDHNKYNDMKNSFV